MTRFSQYMGQNQDVFVNCLIYSQTAPNVIFIMTPIGSVDHELALGNYRPLVEKGLNVFAVDLPGTGKSSTGTFTYENIKEAIKSVAAFVMKNYSAPIHLYGGTGTGGVIGQALASDQDLEFFKSFSQFGVGNYKDLSILGNDLFLKRAYPVLKLVANLYPKYKVKFKIPKYKGYNAEKENQWYFDTMKAHPGIFDLPLKLVHTLFWLLLAEESPLKDGPKPPTLVMASRHDRYFKEGYINSYYKSLGSEKKLHWFHDSHCIFVWNAQALADQVYDWIEYTNKR
ncbi:serine aminopeptidase domain-containing protein [Fusibacter sp. JL216-2]|uniref:serine aminopeptidase domain-containing protein n=1 Tax=Fusibacter sp. JL216-2 TaxID=3071453 RepID=UPI003D32D161